MKLKYLLTSGYSFAKDEYELKLKYILFNSLLIFNITLVGIATSARLMNAQYSQAIFDAVYVFFALGTFFLARHSKKYFSKLVYFVIFLSFVVVTLSFYASLNIIAGISWYFVLLLSVFFLTGNRDGSIVFILSLASIIFITLSSTLHTSTDIVLGIIPFFVALFFMYFFENRNRKLKKQLLITNRVLQENNEKLNRLYQNSTSELNASKHELLKLQQVLDKSPVSIVITDTKGNIEYSNPWFSKLTGYSEDEAKGINPKVLKSNLHSQKYYTKLWQDITNGHVWNGTFKNVKKDGSIYWESAIIAPVNGKDGELSNFIAIKQEITQQVYLKEKLQQKDKDKVENFEKTLESFVKMVEERDTYTAGHSERVAEYSRLIAKEMNYSKDDCSLIYRAAILHDIGKIATPDNVLLKPGKLSDLEYKLIQEHVSASYDILARIPMYKEFADIIVHHHERYDGRGYPKGLKSEEIPMLSHIMIVADAFDAMTTNRIYKGRKDLAGALQELQNYAGTQFHPIVVQNATIALANIQLHETVNQLPTTDLEKERFSYFYRDQVTNTYNADYLKFILSQNQFTKEYVCINIICMHNFSTYNSNNGWAKGDKLLSDFANELVERFTKALIFRIHGNDFILINQEHIEIDLDKLKKLSVLIENKITLSSRHIDLTEEEILGIEQLEALNLNSEKLNIS